MARIYLYADESGNFDFSRKPSASKYFILTTVRIDNHAIGNELTALRRELAWSGVDPHREFHATEDLQTVRDRVFQVIAAHDFRIDVTLLDKPKTQSHIRATEDRFYRTAWYYHMRHVTPKIASKNDELLVVAASVGTKKKRAVFYNAIKDVMQQVTSAGMFKVAYWPAAIEPCLQVADYCSWAVQRKWENGDARSYDLIRDKIRSEYDLFRSGQIEYY